MSSLRARIGDQHPIEHRRSWGRRLLRGLIVLVGLLVPVGCEAGQQSAPARLLLLSQMLVRHLYNQRNHACG